MICSKLLLQEQLCLKKQLHFLSVGTDVSSLWEKPRDVNLKRCVWGGVGDETVKGLMVLCILMDFSPLQAAGGSAVDLAPEAERRMQPAAGFRYGSEPRPSR